MDEQWRPVVGYEERYSVSNLGRVRREERTYSYEGRWGTTTATIKQLVLAPFPSLQGYLIVNATDEDGFVAPLRIHRAVLNSFIGPPGEGEVARHLNDVRTDNRLENLGWGTRLDNAQDAQRNGRHNQHKYKTHCKRGHEFNADNTEFSTNVYGSRVKRVCRTCRRARVLKIKQGDH
jgi:hypothetical protein